MELAMIEIDGRKCWQSTEESHEGVVEVASRKTYLEQVYDTVEKLSGLIDMLPEALEKKRLRSSLNGFRSSLTAYQASLTAHDAKVVIIEKDTGSAKLLSGDKAALAVMMAQNPSEYQAIVKGLRQLVTSYGPGNIFERMYGKNLEHVLPVDEPDAEKGASHHA